MTAPTTPEPEEAERPDEIVPERRPAEPTPAEPTPAEAPDRADENDDEG